MKAIRQIEIFSVGCSVCEETIRSVHELACSFCEVEVLDINNPDVASHAATLSIRSILTIVSDGQLASHYNNRNYVPSKDKTV